MLCLRKNDCAICRNQNTHPCPTSNAQKQNDSDNTYRLFAILKLVATDRETTVFHENLGIIKWIIRRRRTQSESLCFKPMQ